MIELLEEAVTLFRLGQEGAGSDALARFTESLWGELAAGRLLLPPERLGSPLQEAIMAQERGDYLWVADMLEHELKPLLISAGQSS